MLPSQSTPTLTPKPVTGRLTLASRSPGAAWLGKAASSRPIARAVRMRLEFRLVLPGSNVFMWFFSFDLVSLQFRRFTSVFMAKAETKIAKFRADGPPAAVTARAPPVSNSAVPVIVQPAFPRLRGLEREACREALPHSGARPY